MGYYICDDCCRFAGDTIQAQVYRAIKQLDPFHLPPELLTVLARQPSQTRVLVAPIP